MIKLESQNVEDINISFNQDIDSYVIDVSYRRTDREGNQDMKLVEFILQPKKWLSKKLRRSLVIKSRLLTIRKKINSVVITVSLVIGLLLVIHVLVVVNFLIL